VSNPNPIEVKVASFTYALDLSEQPFLTGESDDGLQLKGKGDTKLRLPVALTFADAIGTAQATAGQDVIPFTLRGDFGFDTPLGQVKVPYEDSGELPVLRVPKIRLAAARVAELKPLKNTARLEIDLGVAHDQGSPLGFADFDYALGLNGAEIATGLVADLATVQPGKEATVTLPVDLNLLSLGTSIVTAITKKEKVQLSLDAGLDVSTPLGVLPLSIDETGKLQLQ
jgi:LEA14-like dessication related protein